MSRKRCLAPSRARCPAAERGGLAALARSGPATDDRIRSSRRLKGDGYEHRDRDRLAVEQRRRELPLPDRGDCRCFQLRWNRRGGADRLHGAVHVDARLEGNGERGRERAAGGINRPHVQDFQGRNELSTGRRRRALLDRSLCPAR